MRTIAAQSIPQDTDTSKFPDGTVQNETDSQDGTPVVREIYGDIITNIYAYIRSRGIAFNQIEDNELNGYQLIQALKKQTNELNDIEQILNLQGNSFSVDLEIEILPEKYVFFAKAAENYIQGSSYNFRGTSLNLYPFESNGFSTGDELMVVINTEGVKAYNLSSISGTSPVSEILEKFVPMGNPLSYNDNPNEIYYWEDDFVINSDPKVLNVRQIITNFILIEKFHLIDVIMIKENLLVTVKDSENGYYFYKLSGENFNTVNLVTNEGFDASQNGLSYDYGMHCFFDGTHMYLTNAANGSATAQNVKKCLVNLSQNKISFVEDLILSPVFQNTTNGVAHNGKIYTLENGKLRSFQMLSGVENLDDLLFDFPSFNGLLFKLGQDCYWVCGEVAKKWTLE